MRTASHALTAFALAAAPAATQPNLIANGGFEAGATGFSSDYSFCAGGNGSTFNGAFADPSRLHPAGSGVSPSATVRSHV